MDNAHLLSWPLRLLDPDTTCQLALPLPILPYSDFPSHRCLSSCSSLSLKNPSYDHSQDSVVSTPGASDSDFPLHLKTPSPCSSKNPLETSLRESLGADWFEKCKEDTGEVLTKSATLWDESLPRPALPSPVEKQLRMRVWGRQTRAMVLVPGPVYNKRTPQRN